jgi:hypothetical protein
MAVRLSTSARNAATDAISALVDADAGAGSIKIYTGSQPATPNTTATGTLLATVVLADPAFGASSAGVATGTDPASVTAVGTGTAGWWRMLDNSGDAVMDGTVADGSLVLSDNNIVTGGSVDITALSHTTPLG